jgi:hypothetical protein
MISNYKDSKRKEACSQRGNIGRGFWVSSGQKKAVRDRCRQCTFTATQDVPGIEKDAVFKAGSGPTAGGGVSWEDYTSGYRSGLHVGRGKKETGIITKRRRTAHMRWQRISWMHATGNMGIMSIRGPSADLRQGL